MKKILLIIFLLPFLGFSQVIGDYRSNGVVTFTSNTNWQRYDGTIWVTATAAPNSFTFGSSNTITVQSGNVVSVSGTVTVLNVNISISGTINLTDNSYLTVGGNSDWSNFTINSGGNFKMPGGSGLATFVLYGDYNNNGSTDFWKSNVVITGDLLSPATSELQKQGNVIVGGNIIGNINTTGGDGSGQIYAVNPNSTVTITPTSVDGNVIPGTPLPSSEGTTLINLVNTIIYGSSTCTFFTINDPASNISTCLSETITVTISTNGSSPVYQWQVNSGSSGWNDISEQTSSVLLLVNVTASMSRNKYRIKVTSGGCTKNSNYITLVINPSSVGGTVSANQSICSGSTPSDITLTGSTGTIQWQSSSDNSTFNDISGATSSTLLSAMMGVLTSTRYYRAVVKSSSCSAVNSGVVTVIVSPLPSTPTAGTVTQPTCASTKGSFAISNYNSSFTYSVAPSTGVVISGNTVTAPAGTYTITAASGSCSASSTPVVITSAVITTTIYNGTTWSNGTGLDKVGTITAPTTTPITISAYTELCSCMVSGSTNVVVNSDVTLKLQDKLVVKGSLTFENNASLVQINDNAANSGEITYKRKIPTIRKTDYVYWSSPVSNFTLGGIQTGTLYYSFDGVANDYVKAYPTTVMDKGKGYIVRGAGTGFDDGTIDITTSFKGIPNNGGNFIVPVTGAGTTNLIGNPYPSALSADAFLAANNKILEGTLYFWTHNTSIRLKGELNPGTAGSGAYAYTSDDYAAYNFTGGIATTGKGEESISKASTIPNGFIASGVAFFAEGIASGGNLIFKNEMRLSSVVTGSTILDNSQVFRTAVSGTKKAKIAPANSIEKNRVWLNLTNAQGAFKQILVGYVTGATNDYDNGYDGESFDGNDFIDFYSINQNKNLTIQGRALPFDATDSVPLGYSSTIEGGFSISIEEVDGTMQSQSVFLEDRVLNVVQDLKVSPYTFNTAAGTFHDRFVLRYTDRTLGNVDFDKTNNQVSISKDKNDLKVKSEIETIKQITVFDLLGKKVFEKEAVNSNEFSSSAFGLSKQVGIVKVTLANGQVISKKVVF